MRTDLSGKAAIVTGSTEGIGFAAQGPRRGRRRRHTPWLPGGFTGQSWSNAGRPGLIAAGMTST